MSPERWQQVEEVYYGLLEAPADQRDEVLDRTCHGDPELRREVESLLRSEDKLGDFLSASRLYGHIAQIGGEAEAIAAGTTVGRYRILSAIGAGAMGEVYLAQDTSLDRQVALKLLPRRFTGDSGRIARFMREAKAASALNHPNIITIHEIGQAGDIWFIATEFIPGGTARDLLASSGKLPFEDALKIAIQCSVALGKAHNAGILHRDIKPENIMIRPDGLVKVVDFGLARVSEGHAEPGSSAGATQAGMILGTPRYMSPEQARGEAIDSRSDIFSLGSVLYELVSDRPAFPGASTAEVFAALLGSEPDLPVTGLLHAVISKALAKDPAARYQTMEEFAEALRRFDPARAKAIRVSDKNLSLRRRVGQAVLAAAVAAAAGLAAYAWISRNAAPAGPLRVVPLATFAGSKGYVALSPDGSRIAFSWQPPRGGPRHIYIKPVGEGDPVQLTFAPYDDVCPAWSPDGRQIAFCRQPKGEGNVPQEIYFVSADGSGERKIVDGFRGVSWSPDGKTLALTHAHNEAIPPARESGGVFLFSLATGQSRELTVGQRDTFAAFSPDGKWVGFKRVLSGGSTRLLVVRAEGGPVRELTSDRLQPIRAVAWTPDSREIVFAALRSGADGSLWRVPITGGAPRPLSAILRDASDPSISKQGRLAYREEWIDNNLYLRTAKQFRGSVPSGFSDPVAAVNSSREDHSPAFSPDGERIAFVSERSGYLEIWVARRDGSQEVPLTSMQSQNTGTPRWSPDGKQIAFDSWALGKSNIFVVNSSGGAPRALTGGALGSWMASWSPDGKWIYFSRGLSSATDVWRIPASGGEPMQITHSGAFESHPSPDGKIVYYSKPEQGGGRSIWFVPAAGGVEQPVPELQGFRRILRSWGVIEQGIFFLSYEDVPKQTVRFFDFRTRKVTSMFPLQKQPPWGIGSVTLSRDGRYALTAELDQAVNELMMIENFR